VYLHFPSSLDGRVSYFLFFFLPTSQENFFFQKDKTKICRTFFTAARTRERII